MPLIAITREMGSLGKDVAAGVGEALGIPVVYHEVIDVLANKMRLRKSHVVKLLEGHANILERLTADQTSLSIYTADETFGLAARGRGAVVRSWGAANLLRSVQHVVCVRVCAPMALRVARMKERIGTDDDEYVAGEIAASDEAHGAIIRRHFDVGWQDAEQYDLVLNTERVSIAQCVDEVLRLAASPGFQETDESRARLDNLRLEAHVRSRLRQAPETRDLRIVVKAENGRVELSGMVDDDEERQAAERVTAAAEGVRAVDNQLRSARSVRSHHRDG